MIIQEAIEKRHSVRKYEETVVENAILKRLRQSIDNAAPLFEDIKYRLEIMNNPQTIKEFKIGFLGGKIRINAPSCIIAISENKEGCYENLGFIQEQIVLEITRLGLGTCWLETFDREIVKKKCNVSNNEIVTNVIAFGYIQRSFYNNGLRKLLKTSKRKDINELVFYKKWNRNSDEYLAKKPNLKYLLKQAILSPSSDNSQPVRMIVDEKKVYILVMKNTKNAYYKLDVGIFISHLYVLAKEKMHLKFDDSIQNLSLPSDVLYIASFELS